MKKTNDLNAHSERFMTDGAGIKIVKKPASKATTKKSSTPKKGK